tara:strand:- start:1531 stop:3540 length:2010 start_codon:yes stop_codon:yes gene_type:complete
MANWWESESSVQSLLGEAFKSALSEYGVAKSGDISSQKKIDTTEVEGNIPKQSQDTSVDMSPESAAKASEGANANQVKKEISAFTLAMSLPAKAVEIYDASLNELSKTINPVLKQYNSIQESYGGLNINLDKAVGSSKAVIDRLQSMQKAYYNVEEAGTQMSKSLGQSGNIASKYFKDEAEYFNASEQVLGALVDQHSQYISVLDDQTLTKLPFYSKALGISSREIAESVERSINSTGKAQTTMLDDIAKFAGGLHKTTGLPLKMIAQSAVQITNDTQRMGDVTAEEATRMAATIGQLGQTYDSFTGVLDKFQEFGSSAETSGLISQITGGAVNLDAQQLMYLASEEQEKFLPELRRSLLGGGFTKETFEALGQSEQRQFASALSMDREKVRALLDTSREFSETDLIDQQAAIDADGTDGFQVIMDNMELAPKYADKTKESMDYLRTQALQPLQQDLLNAADEYSKLNANIRDNISIVGQEGVINTFGKMVRGQGKVAKVMANQIDEPTTLGDFSKIFDEPGANGVNQSMQPGSTVVQPANSNSSPNMSIEPPAQVLSGPAPAYTSKAAASNQVVNPVSPTETDVKVIAKLNAAETAASENAAVSNTGNEATNKQIQALTAALTSYNSNVTDKKEIVLMVDKSELGRILIDGKFIVNGAQVQIVKTAAK